MQVTARPKPIAGALLDLTTLYPPQGLTSTTAENGDVTFNWSARDPALWYLVQLWRDNTYLRIFKEEVVNTTTYTLTQAEQTKLALDIANLSVNISEYDPTRHAIGPGSSPAPYVIPPELGPAPAIQSPVVQSNGDVLITWASSDTTTPLADQRFKIKIYDQNATSVVRTDFVTGQQDYTYTYANLKTDGVGVWPYRMNFAIMQVNASGEAISEPGGASGVPGAFITPAPTGMSATQDDVNHNLVFNWTSGEASPTGTEYYTVILCDAGGNVIRTVVSAAGATTLAYPYSELTADFGPVPVEILYQVVQSTVDGFALSDSSSPGIIEITSVG